MTEPLETTVNKETNGRFRKFLADTFACVSFGVGFGVVNELVIAGLSFEEWVKTRAVSSAMNTVLGRPYGKFRDYVFKKFGGEKSRTRRFVADVVSFASFWMPFYASTLYVCGADQDQIASACLSLTAMSGFLGRPYGLYLDTVRKCFGVKPGYLDSAR